MRSENAKNNFIFDKTILDKYHSGFYVILLFFINYFANGAIQLKGFFMDDLAIWNVYHNNSSFDFIFNTYANKFRPIANIPMLLGFKIAGYNTHILDNYLLIINFIIAVIVFYIISKITNNIYIGVCSSTGYIFSRLAYYQVGQYFGIMEATGLTFAVLTLYFIYKFINYDDDLDKHYIIAIIMFILCVFSHERYMCLIILLLLAPLLKKYKNKKKKFIYYEIISFSVITSILILRYILLKGGSIAGTGGTSITDTINILQVIKFICYGIVNMIGVNAGEAYLTGISVKYVSPLIYMIVFIYLSCIVFTAVLTVKLLTDKTIKKDNIFIKNNILFIGFILLTILSCSITIRLEMRWLYTPFVGCLILYAYWIQYLTKNNYFRKKAIILLTIIIILQIPIELYYRSYYKYVYFTGTQGVYNILYTETIQKYGDSLYMHPIVLIENEEIFIHENEVKNFYAQYKQNASIQDAEVYVYKHLNQIPQEVSTRNPIVVIVDSVNPNDGFKKQVMDITNEYNYSIKN